MRMYYKCITSNSIKKKIYSSQDKKTVGMCGKLDWMLSLNQLSESRKTYIIQFNAMLNEDSKNKCSIRMIFGSWSVWNARLRRWSAFKSHSILNRTSAALNVNSTFRLRLTPISLSQLPGRFFSCKNMTLNVILQEIKASKCISKIGIDITCFNIPKGNLESEATPLMRHTTPPSISSSTAIIIKIKFLPRLIDLDGPLKGWDVN